MAPLDDQVIDDKEVDIPIEETIRAAIRGEDSADVSAASPAPTGDIPPPKPDRVRDETGKFAEAPKEAKRETLTLKDKAPANPQNAVTNPLDATAQTPGINTLLAIKAPESLKPEMKAKFAELSPEWQAEMVRRETEAHTALTRNDEHKTLGRKINEIAMPYLPTIKAEGGTVEKAFSDLLQTAHVLRQGSDMQKANTVAAVMQQFNVSPQALFSILQGGNVNTGQPLQPIAPQQDVAALVQAELAKQNQILEQRSLQSQIEEFASKPGHEHFERVKVLMGSLLESGEAQDLEDAYSQAIYAKPDIRSSLLASQTQANTDKRNAEAKARTEAARRAGGSVSGGPGGVSPLNGSAANVPIEETIRSAIREASGRIN